MKPQQIAQLVTTAAQFHDAGKLKEAESLYRQAIMADPIRHKRGGGTGLISGRKAFQRPMKDGVELLNAIQDVYLTGEITVA